MRAGTRDRPAYRHKDLGIWQVWTWSQVLEEARAYAAGLSASASSAATPSPSSAPTGQKLYWSVAVAQMLGAVPVPVYADAVAEELAYVLAHAETRFAAVEDQEQVDKILSVSERLPKLEQVVYDRPRGLRDYDHSRLHPIDDVIRDGRAARAGCRHRAVARPRDRSRQGLRALDHPLHLGHDRPVQGRCPVRQRLHQGGRRYRRIRQAHRAGRGAPICRWPGSATITSIMRKRWSPASAWPVRRAPRR